MHAPIFLITTLTALSGLALAHGGDDDNMSGDDPWDAVVTRWDSDTSSWASDASTWWTGHSSSVSSVVSHWTSVASSYRTKSDWSTYATPDCSDRNWWGDSNGMPSGGVANTIEWQSHFTVAWTDGPAPTGICTHGSITQSIVTSTSGSSTKIFAIVATGTSPVVANAVNGSVSTSASPSTKSSTGDAARRSAATWILGVGVAGVSALMILL